MTTTYSPATQSQNPAAWVPPAPRDARDGDRFRIHERSAKTTGGAVWTGPEISTARRAADVAQTILAGWTSGARWATCAETGALLYGIDASGRRCNSADYFPAIEPERAPLATRYQAEPPATQSPTTHSQLNEHRNCGSI